MPFNPYTGTPGGPGAPVAPQRQGAPQARPMFGNIGGAPTQARTTRRRPMGPRPQGPPGVQRRGVAPLPDTRLAAPAQTPGPWGGGDPPMSPAMARLIGNGGYRRG